MHTSLLHQLFIRTRICPKSSVDTHRQQIEYSNTTTEHAYTGMRDPSTYVRKQKRATPHSVPVQWATLLPTQVRLTPRTYARGGGGANRSLN